jgi:hypothetical protein
MGFNVEGGKLAICRSARQGGSSGAVGPDLSLKGTSVISHGSFPSGPRDLQQAHTFPFPGAI